MNSFIVHKPCSNTFNSTTFFDSLSSPPNSFFISSKNSPTISNSNTSISKSSNIFSFQTSADPSYTYINTYCTCFSTIISLILIFIYNLYTVTKPSFSIKQRWCSYFCLKPRIVFSFSLSP